MNINQGNSLVKGRGGFTLAEALMATVVLGIAAAGVTYPYTVGAGLRVEGFRRTLGAKLASDKMEQVLSMTFNELGSYSESQGKGEVTDAAGVVFTDPAYTNFSRQVNCQYVSVPQQPVLEENQCNYILVTVTVHWNSRDIATINRLVSK